MIGKSILFLLILQFSLSISVPNCVYAQKEPVHLKVMTYNIWNGFDWGKDQERKKNWIKWIKEKEPDVLALQELCGYNEKELKEDALKWGHSYAVILKQKGYPVGLTSKQPIILKERVIEDMWHGMLHCNTYGIDFFVVHLSPSDCDFRLKEARIITQKIKNSNPGRFIILGDFNSHSPFESEVLKYNKSLLNKYRQVKPKSKYSNLRLGNFDYAVISTFLSLPAIDVAQSFIDLKNRYTFPTQAIESIYLTAEEISRNKERIDYIFTDPELSKTCKRVRIFNKGTTATLSDHFPVMAEFVLQSLQ